MSRIGFSSAPGARTHSQLPDVSTPHTLADLVAAVCSEAEAAGLINDHKGNASAHHAKTTLFTTLTDRWTLAQAHRGVDGKIMVFKGPGADPEEEDKPGAGIWTLAETLSPSNVTSISSSILGAHSLWMVIIDVSPTVGVADEFHAYLRFNDDSANNYDYRHIDDTAIIVTTAQTRIEIGSYPRNPVAKYSFFVHLLIQGKSPGYSVDDRLAVVGTAAQAREVGYNRLSNAGWACGTANITKMTFIFEAAAITGKIKLFYMDF